MKILFCLRLPLILSALVLCGAVFATESQSVTIMEDNRRVVTGTQMLRAVDYGLTDIEMSRYYEIMKGPMGRWYHDLDPTWVLGFASETAEERQHYATLVAEMEFRRVENELAFNRAYSDAIIARKTASSMIDEARWSRSRNDINRTQAVPVESADGRLSLFVNGACSNCDDVVLGELRSAGLSSVDIFLANMADDKSIREWARRLAIDFDAVATRRITLNHDVGAFTNQLNENDEVVVFYPGPFGPLRRSEIERQ